MEKILGFTMQQLLERNPTNGEVGLEIELEGKSLPKSNVPYGWSYHEDHSLRGEDNAEYVLTKPIKFDDIDLYLKGLWDGLAKSRIDRSNRTSVHVHLNVQNWYMDRLATFFALYITVEELLTQWAGDHRVGNLFCLRTKDAPAIITSMCDFIKSNGNFRFGNGMHYAGLNISALQKFGSIEVRTMRGPMTPDEVSQWVRFLRRLYDFAASTPDPRSVCDKFSTYGPMSFLSEIFGPETNALVSQIGWPGERIKESLYEGIRMAQEVCYCLDWDAYQKVELRPDPFDRTSTSQTIRKLKKAQAEAQAATSEPNLNYLSFEEPEEFFEDSDIYEESENYDEH